MRPVKVRGSSAMLGRPGSQTETLQRYTYSLERRTALEICKDYNTPRSMAVWYLLSEDSPESVGQLLNLPPPIQRQAGHLVPSPRGVGRDLVRRVTAYLDEVCIDAFARDYLVSEVMVKNPGLNSGIDRRAAALKKFLEAEEACAQTNDRLYRLINCADHPSLVLIGSMKRTIAKVLGRLSSRKLQTAATFFGFGPGATSAVSGADVVLSRKHAGELHCTPRLYPYVNALTGPVWGAFPSAGTFVLDESRTTTVPKNAKTDRVIAIEPHLNIYVQKGIGHVIRSQLKHFGIDLSTQAWNQVLASKALEWELATVDLSSASDTVSHRLVKLLLPPEWYQLLMLCRTDFTVVDGQRVALSKFSSMGNGYTFELETLIFYAAALAVGSHKDLTMVYGDDIIVERRVVDQLIDLLNLIGFKTNAKKTCTTGVFYESCGTDWYLGVDVRPLYFKGDYVDRTQCHFSIPNALRRYAHRRRDYRGCDLSLKKAWWSAYRRLTPLERRTAIPDGSGDDGLVLNWDESAPSRLWSRDYQSWQGRVLPLRPAKSSRTVASGAYVASLRALLQGLPPSEISRMEESMRGRVVRSDKLRSQPTLGWAELGPWS